MTFDGRTMKDITREEMKVALDSGEVKHAPAWYVSGKPCRNSGVQKCPEHSPKK